MVRVVGIDAGVSGAIALFTDEPVNRPVVADLPTTQEERAKHRELDYAAIRDLVWAFRPEHVFIEIVNARPGRDAETGEDVRLGASSMFRFGGSFFALKAIVCCLDITPRMVASQSWKGHFGMRGGKASKEQARLLAVDKFPALTDLLKRKKDHQRAEAYLIAAYGAYKLGHRDPSLSPIAKPPKLSALDDMDDEIPF